MDAGNSAASWRPTMVDVRIVVSVVVCCLVATALSALDVKFAVGEMRLDIIQKLTACISCLLCCQADVPASTKAGTNRVLVTVVGCLVGVAVVGLDLLLGQNPWLLVLLMALGLLVTLCLCRLVGAPAVAARIGGISFLLVASTLTGPARLWYALFRVVSTIFGAIVSVLVTRFLPERA